MKLDFGSLAFGYSVKVGGSTPNWATSLGQGKEYKINDTSDIDEILKGLVYSSVPLKTIFAKIGKGGKLINGAENDSPIIMGSFFKKIFVNEQQIIDGKYVLIVTRDTSESHAGRLRLKYGPANTYSTEDGAYTNQDFFDTLKKQLNLADDACWFVSELKIENQDELHLTAVIVNSLGAVEYEDSTAMHEAWKSLLPCDFNDSTDIDYATGGFNLIYYGAPGCGKSKNIRKLMDAQHVDDENRFYVTFHPEYSNCDFIGQIMPSVNKVVDYTTNEVRDVVKYTFNPGPFTLALERAYNTSKMVYLVIDEINRGNAAAIFGDLFQLLDRNNGEDDSSIDGESEYRVTNVNMQEYLLERVKDNSIKAKLSNGVYIPSNLTIFATMNSSDQNVFTMDTAFKRRWNFEQMDNNIEDDTEHSYKDYYIPGTELKWRDFLVMLNNRILDTGLSMQTNEDKRIGKYFVTKEYLTQTPKNIKDVQETAKMFAYKILEYIWNDVCKLDRNDWFDSSKYKTLEDVIKAFLNPQDGNPLSVFVFSFNE